MHGRLEVLLEQVGDDFFEAADLAVDRRSRRGQGQDVGVERADEVALQSLDIRADDVAQVAHKGARQADTTQSKVKKQC